MSNVKPSCHTEFVASWNDWEGAVCVTLEDYERVEAHLKKVIDFLKGGDLSSGVCMCGDSINGHDNPMNCGHSPVDSGEYYIGKFIEEYEGEQ